MLNYIKADFYRLFKSKGFYVALILLVADALLTAVLPPMLNMISLGSSSTDSYETLLFKYDLIPTFFGIDGEPIMNGYMADFKHTTATVALFKSLWTASIMMVFVIAIVSMFLMAEHRSHTFKNSISKGFSRQKVVNIKFVELFILSVIFFILHIGTTVLSALIFHSAGKRMTPELWTAFFAGFGMQILYIAALCAFAVFLGFTFKKGAAFNTVYLLTMLFHPVVLLLPHYAWKKIPDLSPYSLGLLMNEASVITETLHLTRVIVEPIVIIVVFFTLAHLMFRKAEIK